MRFAFFGFHCFYLFHLMAWSSHYSFYSLRTLSMLGFACSMTYSSSKYHDYIKSYTRFKFEGHHVIVPAQIGTFLLIWGYPILSNHEVGFIGSFCIYRVSGLRLHLLTMSGGYWMRGRVVLCGWYGGGDFVDWMW